MRKILMVSLSLLLLLMTTPIPSAALKEETGNYDRKDEVIYGKLTADGQMKEMYVVNSFHIIKEGSITDYGHYESVRNLTNLEPINQSQDRYTFFADEKNFYYQGELQTKSLPWNISIKYLLDGVETPPEQLAGKSGELEIHILTKQNEDVDPLFFENYLLQITLTFDPLTYEDIQAPKGTEAKEGKNELINFTVLPGQEETLITTATANEISLDPIQISAIPANIALEEIDTGDMREDIESLTDAIGQVHEGVSEFKKGIEELNSGAIQLTDGSTEFANGMRTVDDSSSELVSGSKQILDVLEGINKELASLLQMPEIDLEQLKILPGALREVANNVKNFTDRFDEYREIIDEIAQIEIDENQIEEIIEALKNAGIDEQIIDRIVASYYLAKDLADGVEEYREEIKRLFLERAEALYEIADEMERNFALFDDLKKLEQLPAGFGELATEYGKFHDGLIQYTDGVHTLATEYGKFDEGIHDFADGVGLLEDGVKELHAGTGELHRHTKDLPDELKSEIEKMLEEFDFSDFEPTSFVSNKNNKIGIVQFVLRTEPIEVEEKDIEEKEDQPKKSLWQRFLDLFRKK